MWSCILLHNWRTETAGRNQIRTYFDEIVKPLDQKEKDEECFVNAGEIIE